MKRFGLMGLVFIGFVAGMFYVYSCGGGSSSSAATTITAYASVNPGACQYYTEEGDYYYNWNELLNQAAASAWFICPVQLPHGAIVTEFTSYWDDTEAGTDIEVDLYRASLNNTGWPSMAGADSSGSAGVGNTVDATINLPTVDNSQYSYVVAVVLKAAGDSFYGAVIEYDYTY